MARGIIRRALGKTAQGVANGVALAISLTLLLTHPAAAIEEAQAAKGPPFKVPVFISSRTDVCYDPGDVAAIKQLTLVEQDRINARGGVSGRPIELEFLDDKREEATTLANVRAAMSDSQTLAMIGISNSTRGKAVFDALGGDILKSGIPFITDLSVSSLFAAYPNVYTTRASQESDSVPVIAKFTKQLNFTRPAFMSLKDAVASSELGAGLKAILGEGGLVADIRVGVADDKPVADDMAAAIAQIREQRPDLLYLYIGGNNIASVMGELVASGVTPALFIGGRIESAAAPVVRSALDSEESLGRRWLTERPA